MGQWIRLDQDDTVLAVGASEEAVLDGCRPGEYATWLDDNRVCEVGEPLPRAPECAGQESLFV